MGGGSAGPDLRNSLTILGLVVVAGDLSDADLGRRFLTGPGPGPDAISQAALTALVERHGPMVLAPAGGSGVTRTTPKTHSRPHS